ncbi:S-methyl-5-thioadenosine phosphorylase [Thelotrema lepadinum]|nr:S-methyl-5-thioadenosine phosphorylase [Thelotrema lepadinum]
MASLPKTFDGPVRIAIIGGTGLSSLPNFEPIAELPLTHPTLTTPWGQPSSPITILSHPRDKSSATSTSPELEPLKIAFLSRHGLHHEYAPHEVPFRANIAALRKLGVRCVIAFSASGSLQEAVKPRDFVLPHQILDRTKGIRPLTFFEDGAVVHVPFADPFDNELRDVVIAALDEKWGEGREIMSDRPIVPDGKGEVLPQPKIHDKGTLVCIEGPQFSTRAESHLYRSWGASVINMSVIPEAKLAREAEMSYAMICMSTDYDCWREDEVKEGEEGAGDVSVKMVMANMAANAGNAKRVAAAVVEVLGGTPDLIKGPKTTRPTRQVAMAGIDKIKRVVNGEKWRGQSRGGLAGMTADSKKKEKVVHRLKWLFEDWQ